MEYVRCPECEKKVKNLRLHYKYTHSGIPVPDLREIEAVYSQQPPIIADVPPPEPEPKAKPEPEATTGASTQPALFEKLKLIGVQPDDVIKAFAPLIETSVVKTLDKLQLGTLISQKIAEVEAKISGQIKPLTDLVAQVQSGANPGDGPGNSAGANNGNKDAVVQMLIQRFLAPPQNNFGNLEQLTNIMKLTNEVARMVNAPYIQGGQDKAKEIGATLRLLRDAGATPEQAGNTIAKRLEIV